MIDIQKARTETPGCSDVIHLNNAGASLMPAPVIASFNEYFNLEIMRGGYEAAALAEKTVSNFYHAASKLIGCEPSEIAFTENATRAWDLAFYSLKFEKGDRIITSAAEYGSNYIAMLQVARKTGAIIDVVENDESGQLSLQDLKNKIGKKTKLIAITHVPTQGGLINPVKEVGKIAKEANVFYLLDATQSVGQMPVNVQEIGCDALCATGRKYLRAPRGTGFLYVSKMDVQQMEPPILDIQAATWTGKNTYEIKPDASRFETWEVSYANKVALGAAIDYAMAWGIEDIWSRIKHLSSFLREQLSDISGVTLQDLGKEKCGIITFTVNNLTAEQVKDRLQKLHINVSVSKAEYARLDMDQRGLSSIVRASVHYYNTEEELARFCAAIKKVSKRT